MEVHSLVGHNVAKTTPQPLGAHCQNAPGGWSAKSPYLYKPQGLLAGPLPHRQHSFIKYL
jgi:hypothetical protein